MKKTFRLFVTLGSAFAFWCAGFLFLTSNGFAADQTIKKKKERDNSSTKLSDPGWFQDLERGRRELDPNRTENWKRFYEDLFRKYPELKSENLEHTLDRATFFSDQGTATCYYLSPNGSDSNTGTKEQPFRTAEHVRDFIRTQKKQGRLTGPVRIIFKAGIYPLKDTFRLSSEDSGTREAPISYEAEENGKAVLSGGSVFKANALKRIARTKNSGSDLWEGEFRLNGSEKSQTVFRPKQLFINGRRMTPARFPNEDLSELNRRGFLYHGRGESLLAGLSCSGDFLEWTFSISKTDEYSIWIASASAADDLKNKFRLTIDGQSVPVNELKTSGGWRKICWSQITRLPLTAGEHLIRLDSIAPKGSMTRMHLSRLAFFKDRNERPEVGTPDLLIEARNYSNGASATMPLTFFPVNQSDSSSIFLSVVPGAGWSNLSTGLEAENKKTKSINLADHEIIDSDRIRRWKEDPQAEICIFPAWGWFNSLFRMGSVVSQKDGVSIELIGKEFRELYDGNRFFVYNLRSELDQPGEWYYNEKTGKLSLIPFADQQLEQADLVLPRLSRLVEIKGTADKGRVRFIRLKGLTFSFCDYTEDQAAPRSTEDCALLLENTQYCGVENCRFEHLGGYAIRLTMDSVLNRIDGCEISDMGGGGILLRGPWCGRGETVFEKGSQNNRYYPIGNYLADNTIHDGGRVRIYVAGIHAESRPTPLRYSPGNAFVRQTIYRMPRNGIFCFWNTGGDVVSKNHIHHVLNRTDDGGMIHYCTGALNGTASSLIEKNLLNRTDPFRNEDFQFKREGRDRLTNGHGIYLDDQTSGFVLRENVIAGTRKGAVFLHGGANNLVENNFIFDDSFSQLWESDGWFNTIRGNVFVWDSPNADLFTPPPFEKFQKSLTSTFDYNIIWNGGKDIKIGVDKSWLFWRKSGLDKHSLVIDPKIRKRDLDRKILEFDRRSPIFQFGIKPVDLSGIGAQPIGNKSK